MIPPAAVAVNDAAARSRPIAEHELNVAQMDAHAHAAVARGRADEALQKKLEDLCKKKKQMQVDPTSGLAEMTLKDPELTLEDL